MSNGWTTFIQYATQYRRGAYQWKMPRNVPNDALFPKGNKGGDFDVSTAFIRNMPDYFDHITDHIFILDAEEISSGRESDVAIANEIFKDVTASDLSSYASGKFSFREEYYGARNRSRGPFGISVIYEWRKKADSTQRTKLEYSRYCWNKAPTYARDLEEVCATDINGNTYHAKEYPIQRNYQCSAGAVNGWNIKNKAKYPIVFNYVSMIDIRQPVIPKRFGGRREGGELLTTLIRKISVALPTSRGDIPVPSKKAAPKF